MKRRAKTLLRVSVAVEYPEFYSIVVEGRVAGSAHPSHTSIPEQLSMLRRMDNVRGVISLTQRGLIAGVVEDAGIEYMHLPTTDKCPLSLQDLVRGSAFIDDVNERLGGVVLVHCREGIGRTGTMIAGWMMLSLRFSAKRACEDVRAKRVGSIHQRHQEMRLYQLERVMADPIAMAKLRQGTYDEKHLDFGMLKAATALVFARLHTQSLLQLYYFRWLNATVVSSTKLLVTPQSCSSSPKFLDELRSPQWKPKLDLALYMERVAREEAPEIEEAEVAASPRGRPRSLPPMPMSRAIQVDVPCEQSVRSDDELSSSAGMTQEAHEHEAEVACSPRASRHRRLTLSSNPTDGAGDGHTLCSSFPYECESLAQTAQTPSTKADGAFWSSQDPPLQLRATSATSGLHGAVRPRQLSFTCV